MSKKIVFITVSLIIMLGAIGFFVFNNNQSEHRKAYVEERLQSSWEDIIQTYNLDKSQYTSLQLGEYNSFREGKFQGFEDTEFCREIISIVYDMDDTSAGSLKPIVLIKKDKTEIIFAYKDKAGNNILRKANRKDDTWVRSEDIRKGSPIKEID